MTTSKTACRAAGAAALIALALAGCSNGSHGEPFASAPYVQNVTTATAVVAMATESPSVLTVEWGEATLAAAAPGAPLPSRASESAPATIHDVEISGLAPDTAYAYRVLTADGTPLGGATFRTPPLPGTRPVTFVAFGDSGQVKEEVGGIAGLFKSGKKAGREADLGRAIEASDPAAEMAIHTGDVVYPDGARKDYAKGFFQPFAGLIDHVPVYPVIGNHDFRSEGGAPWTDAFQTPANNAGRSERYYSFDWGDVHFAALDVFTTPYGPGSPQIAWLAEDLAASTAAWKVVFFHVPPFSDARHGDDAAIQQNILPVLVANHVDVVFSGHDHCYERMRPIDGVTYIVTGGGGADLYELNPSPRLAAGVTAYHFVRCRADARTFTIEAVDLAGNVMDRATLEK
jgi:3',5'-cyclic AMP phosphodiesterase CpdA